MTRKHGPHRLQKPSSTCSQWTRIFQRLPFPLLFLPSLTAHFPARISADHLLNKQPVRESLSQGLFLGESKATLHFSPLPILVPSTCLVLVGVKKKKKFSRRFEVCENAQESLCFSFDASARFHYVYFPKTRYVPKGESYVPYAQL